MLISGISNYDFVTPGNVNMLQMLQHNHIEYIL